MKKLSRWAYYHPLLTRRIMIVLKIIIILLAWHIATLLQQLEVSIPADSIYIAGALVLLGIFFYPNPKKKKIYFEKGYYYRQKFCYGLVTFSSFVIFIVAFNNRLMVQGVYGAKPLYYHNITADNTGITPSGDPEKMTARQKKVAKKSFRKQLKEVSAKLKEGEKSTSDLVAEMVLAIALGAALGVVLVWVACSIACAGSELLALLVLVLGAGAIVMGLVAWIRSIKRRKRLRKQELAARKKVPVF